MSGGLFIPYYNLMVFQSTYESLFDLTQSINMSSIGDFNLTTSEPFKIKYIYTKDNLYLFTFYVDKTFFLKRTLNANIYTFANGSWKNPVYVPTPGIGYQCVCFDTNHTAIYLVDKGGSIIYYNIASNTVKTIANIGYSDVENCYFDPNFDSLMLVRTGTLI